MRILFVPESTEGIEAGQMTAMNREEKVGIVANGAGEHGENIAESRAEKNRTEKCIARLWRFFCGDKRVDNRDSLVGYDLM